LNIKTLEKLGKYTREIRQEVSKIVKVGMNITEIINLIEKRIFEKDYLPAFPATVSINDVAAHYTVFDEGIILKKGDVIKIDFGISENGFITDNAFTVEVEDNKYEKLLKANKEGLDKIMEEIKLGSRMSDIGDLVHQVALKEGFETIHNLSGHQIANNNLHCGLSVPNCETGDYSIVEDNIELAVEPFFTVGNPLIKSVGGGNILHLKKTISVRDPIAKKVLNHIKEFYPKLPFSKRWLVNEIVKEVRGESHANLAFDKRKVLYALRILKAQGIIYEYDALATVDGAIVSQFEDTVVFLDGKKSIITRL